jgi:hypothetical protein
MSMLKGEEAGHGGGGMMVTKKVKLLLSILHPDINILLFNF